MKGSFTALNPDAKLFSELKNQQPAWWKLLSNDKELYINIRKDNYINVYYYGGSLARIKFNKDFVATTHQKYLGDTTPRGKNEKGNDIFEYDPINLAALDENMIASIKERIKEDYLNLKKVEYSAEKWIQGEMVLGNPCYIDSEFQFNKDEDIKNLRIDLIELSNGVLTFIELKGISDNRLRNDVTRNSKTPEIIGQMEKYKRFITKYKTDILAYYQTLLEIKRYLNLTVPSSWPIEINETPKLIIKNTYKKTTDDRDHRIEDIKSLLDTNNIIYEITKWKSPFTEASTK